MVKKMMRTKPTIMKDEIVVRPGFGATDVHLGQTEQEVKMSLGKPDRVVRKYEDSYFYIYEDRGISLDFGKRGGKLKIVFFYQANTENQQGAKVKTDSGVQLGDSRSKVLRIYGEPDQKGDPFVLHNGDYFREWFYYLEGIQFRFSQRKKIDEISISRPKKKQIR
ncbi:MAG: hypothetical protein HYR56_07085 [Acidobacteria bacterium]|nr:hypothetical protein [Acidobacteriota bacterium]MBI3428361.1 hypothetical protein [Acidobacteriota bacterium]